MATLCPQLNETDCPISTQNKSKYSKNEQRNERVMEVLYHLKAFSNETNLILSSYALDVVILYLAASVKPTKEKTEGGVFWFSNSR